jgi:hypothetical protein
MIGSKAIAAISLLCALLLCAFGASSASAATSGTTAFTCVENVNHEGDFEDAHCKNTVPKGTGAFTHKAISVNPTGFTASSEGPTIGTTEEAHATLKGVLGGIKTEITCTKMHGHGTLENKLEGEKHSVTGSGTVHFTECKMPVPKTEGGLERCKVKEETIKFEMQGTTKEKGAEMGVLYSPKEGKTFVTIGFENGPGGGCPVAGKEVPVTGSAEGTLGGTPEGHGATNIFTNAMTKGKECEKETQTGICLGGQSAEISGTTTTKMLTTTEGSPENPITLTTPPFTADA